MYPCMAAVTVEQSEAEGKVPACHGCTDSAAPKPEHGVLILCLYVTAAVVTLSTAVDESRKMVDT